MSRQVTYMREKTFAMNLGWKCMMEETHSELGCIQEDNSKIGLEGRG
jgi:hypothetical protein